MTRRHHLPRRRFLELSAGATAAVGLGGLVSPGCAQSRAWLDGIPADARERLPRRALYEGGPEVGVLGLGGGPLRDHHLASDVDAMLEAALDAGVDYWDVSPQYGDAAAEEHLGRTLDHRRDEVFLATKTVARDRDGALQDLEGSLARLRTDHLDLWQAHDISDRDQLDAALADGGALEAMAEMRDQGVVGHVGITGHRTPGPLSEALGRYPFDAMLIPLGPVNARSTSFEGLVDAATKAGAFPVAMKVLAGGALASSLDERRHLAFRYTAGLDVPTMVIGLDSARELSQAIEALLDFEPLDAGERDELFAATDEVLAASSFYWMS